MASLTAGKAPFTSTQTISALSTSTVQARWNVPLETDDLIGHWGAPVISNGEVSARSAHAIDASHVTGSLAAISAQNGRVLRQAAIGVAAAEPLIQQRVV